MFKILTIYSFSTPDEIITRTLKSRMVSITNNIPYRHILIYYLGLIYTMLFFISHLVILN